MHVTKCDHRIHVVGIDTMVIHHWEPRDENGQPKGAVVQARRADGVWSVSLPNLEHEATTYPTRAEAIAAMYDIALQASQKDGLSIYEPHVQIGDRQYALRDLP